MPTPIALEHYETLKQQRASDLKSDATLKTIKDLRAASGGYLETCVSENLVSSIAGKEYFAFSNGKKLSRAINAALYGLGEKHFEQFLEALGSGDYEQLDSDQITAAIYNIAISFCALIDLEKPSQKTPGTYFEYLVGHLFSRRLNVNPRKELDVLNLDMESKLPTDFTFDLGINQAKFHVPVKTSTRERVIQVWAHQRVLDGVYGTGRFLGTLVCMSETKTDKKKKEVIEICLPDQWRIYQLFIARLERIYYLDLPATYANLNNLFPRIPVSKLGDFFKTDIVEMI